MSSKYFVALLAGLSFAAVAGGCDSSVENGETGGASDGAGGDTNTGTGGGGGETATDTGTGTTTSVTDTGTTTTAKPDENNSFETAEEIELAKPIQSDLSPIDGDVDYYKFEGKKGQVILIGIDSKPQTDEFDPTYPDIVVTLYDAQKQALAENDDPTPRTTNDPRLYTILPADGTYYLRVTECNTWATGDVSCAPIDAIAVPNYALGVSEVVDEGADDGFMSEAEPNNSQDASNPFDPFTSDAGNVSTFAWGNFSANTDVDYFSFTIPDSVPVEDDTRLIGNLDFLPHGASGSGSTTEVGLVSIIDAENGKVVAETDISKGDDVGSVAPPLTAGKLYYAAIRHPGGTAGTNDFYFVSYVASGGNPVEQSDEANSNPATPEELVEAENPLGLASYFIEGDITDPATDLDHFVVEVPDGAATVSVTCGALRSGSGLRDLTISLLNNGELIDDNAEQLETEEQNAFIQAVAVPDAAELVLKITAGEQDADVTSTFYRCGVHFAVPEP